LLNANLGQSSNSIIFQHASSLVYFEPFETEKHWC